MVLIKFHNWKYLISSWFSISNYSFQIGNFGQFYISHLRKACLVGKLALGSSWILFTSKSSLCMFYKYPQKHFHYKRLLDSQSFLLGKYFRNIPIFFFLDARECFKQWFLYNGFQQFVVWNLPQKSSAHESIHKHAHWQTSISKPNHVHLHFSQCSESTCPLMLNFGKTYSIKTRSWMERETR